MLNNNENLSNDIKETTKKIREKEVKYMKILKNIVYLDQ